MYYSVTKARLDQTVSKNIHIQLFIFEEEVGLLRTTMFSHAAQMRPTKSNGRVKSKDWKIII